MKPLTLKEPTKCCAASLLVWVPAKSRYTCPCGTTQTDIDGRLVGKRAFNYGRRTKDRDRD